MSDDLTGFRRGLKAAADFVARRREDYIRDHGLYDHTTGVTEFPGTGEETVAEWDEIEEGIRALNDARNCAGAVGAAAQPVAWQNPNTGHCVIVRGALADIYTVPLYAHPPQDMESLRVRTLKWEGYGASLTAGALGLDVFYMVNGAPGNWTLASPGARAYVSTHGYVTQSAAKAAAQVDLDRRIRAELNGAGDGGTEPRCAS